MEMDFRMHELEHIPQTLHVERMCIDAMYVDDKMCVFPFYGFEAIVIDCYLVVVGFYLVDGS